MTCASRQKQCQVAWPTSWSAVACHAMGNEARRAGGGGDPRAGNGGHERALHRVPRRTFVKLRDDFVWDEPQFAVATVACAAAARAGPRKSRFSLIGLGGSSRYGGRFNVHDNAQR